MRTLEGLGLGRIGRSATCDISQPSVRAQLTAVDFLVAVAPLTLDATSFASYEPGARLTERELARDKVGRTFFTDRNEFAYLERQPGDLFVAIWSSALPAASALQRLEAAGLSPGRGQAAVIEPDGPKDLPAEEAWERLRHAPAYARFARIIVDKWPMIWECTTFPKHVDDGYLPGRLGLQIPAKTVDSELLRTLISTTATPELAPHAEEIASRSARLGDEHVS